MCKKEKDSRETNSAILQFLQQHLLNKDPFVLHNMIYHNIFYRILQLFLTYYTSISIAIFALGTP